MFFFLRAVVVATGEYKHRRRDAYAFTTIYNCIIHDSEIARMFVIVDTWLTYYPVPYPTMEGIMGRQGNRLIIILT